MPQPGDGREWTEHWRGQRALPLFTAVAYFMCSSWWRAEHPTKTGVDMGAEFAVPLGQRTHMLGKETKPWEPHVQTEQGDNSDLKQGKFPCCCCFHDCATPTASTCRVGTPEYETHQVIAEQRHHCPHQKGYICSVLISLADYNGNNWRAHIWTVTPIVQQLTPELRRVTHNDNHRESFPVGITDCLA